MCLGLPLTAVFTFSHLDPVCISLLKAANTAGSELPLANTLAKYPYCREDSRTTGERLGACYTAKGFLQHNPGY